MPKRPRRTVGEVLGALVVNDTAGHRCECGAVIDPRAKSCRPCAAERRGNGNPQKARVMAAQGYDTEYIAHALGIAEITAKRYVRGAQRVPR